MLQVVRNVVYLQGSNVICLSGSGHVCVILKLLSGERCLQTVTQEVTLCRLHLYCLKELTSKLGLQESSEEGAVVVPDCGEGSVEVGVKQHQTLTASFSQAEAAPFHLFCEKIDLFIC